MTGPQSEAVEEEGVCRLGLEWRAAEEEGEGGGVWGRERVHGGRSRVCLSCDSCQTRVSERGVICERRLAVGLLYVSCFGSRLRVKALATNKQLII